MEMAVRRMIERRVEGVAVMTFGMEEALLENPQFRKVPLVFVDVGPPVSRVSNIKIDYHHGIRQAVQHLAALRHKRIAFVTGPSNLKSAVTRRTAFQESMREIGMEPSPELIITGDHTMEGGMEALEHLSALRDRPTGIICSNDMTAIGIVREAYEVGLRIPQDLSIVGFDDIKLAQFTTPPLTTVQMSQAELAKLAFNALMNEVRRDSPAPHGTEYTLTTNLVLRKSTALAPSQGTGTNRS
jgi:LacI family transcriptional regulator